MSEIVSERLKKSIGKRVKVFLYNGFRYEGVISGCDKIHLEIIEAKGFKIIPISEINDLTIENE